MTRGVVVSLQRSKMTNTPRPFQGTSGRSRRERLRSTITSTTTSDRSPAREAFEYGSPTPTTTTSNARAAGDLILVLIIRFALTTRSASQGKREPEQMNRMASSGATELSLLVRVLLCLASAELAPPARPFSRGRSDVR